jgi:hypothetical protein
VEAVCYGRKTKYRTSSIAAPRISPAVFYGRKKQNHEVIKHILSVSVRKRGDLEITTKSCFTSFCSW